MASNVSQTSLCQRSLMQIGGKFSVSSVFPSDGSNSANACNLLYLPTYEQLARTAWWSSFSAQKTLTLLAAAAGTPEGGPNGTNPLPPSPWNYQYSYDSDILKARAIVPTFPAQGTGISIYSTNNASPIWLRGRGQIPFKVGYALDINRNPIKVILTNQSQAQLIYTVDQPNPSVWDVQFQAAYVAALAAFLVPALSMNLPLMQLQIGIAERIIADARASDGNEGTNSQDNTPDWIRARAGGSGGWYEGTWQGIGYDNMNWPGGG